MVDHGARALLIGLDRQPKAVPARKRRIGERRRDHVERQFQPVGFLGIDGEIQIVGLRLPRQIDQPRHQLAHHARAAHRLVARMQRRQFDGNAGPVGQGPVARGAADRLDRARIGVEIARGVARRCARLRRACRRNSAGDARQCGSRPRPARPRWFRRARNGCPSAASPAASRRAPPAGRGVWPAGRWCPAASRRAGSLRADRPSAQADALTSNALDLVS